MNCVFHNFSCHIGNGIEGSVIRASDSTSSFQRDTSEDGSMFSEPARITAQISIDDCRRSELANILRDKESRAALINQWMCLIEEKRETDQTDIEKLFILLSGICDYLDKGNTDSLENALDQVCDRTTMDSDLRIDLERSFYLFIKATNNVLSSRNVLPPHVLFALDNIIRRIAEHLVGFIRPDFIPAINNMIPLTPNTDLQISRSSSNNNIDEMIRLHEQYTKLVERNREQLHRLIKLESNNNIKLTELINNQRNNTSSKTIEIFFPVETPITTDDMNSPIEQSNGIHTTPMSRGIKRSRALFDLEQEHERLLKDITDNRTRLNKILHS